MRQTLSHSLNVLFCSLLMVAASSCQQQSAKQLNMSQMVSAPLTLVAGDLIRISVFNQPDLSTEYHVSAAGMITMPFAGSISAAGRTTEQVAAALAEKLQPKYLRNPKVNVQLLSNRPIYLLGEVNQPGSYPHSEELSVAKAVALAGGFTYRAATKRIFIARTAMNGTVTEYRVTINTPIRGGDVIRVAERFF